MRWISNGDPPLYVWACDEWYNQKDKKLYMTDLLERKWREKGNPVNFIEFPKKTKIVLKNA